MILIVVFGVRILPTGQVFVKQDLSCQFECQALGIKTSRASCITIIVEGFLSIEIMGALTFILTKVDNGLNILSLNE